MTLTPEKKLEIENEIAKFLRHLAEKKERIDVDVVDVKNFGPSLSMHPTPASLSVR